MRGAAGIGASLVAAVALAAGTGTTQPPAPAGDRHIEYRDDRLTVRLSGVPLEEVLREVARQAGARVRGQLREPHDVTVAFENVPLSDALHRIIQNQNFTLVYGGDGRLRAVRLLGPPTAGPQGVTATPAAATPAAGPTTTLAASPANLLMQFSRHAPVPVSGRVADAIGTSHATLEQLMTAAMRNDDPAVRSDALRTFLIAVEAEPALKDGVAATMTGMDDQALLAALQGMAGEHVNEVLAGIATRARTPELRSRAAELLKLGHKRPGS